MNCKRYSFSEAVSEAAKAQRKAFDSVDWSDEYQYRAHINVVQWYEAVKIARNKGCAYVYLKNGQIGIEDERWAVL